MFSALQISPNSFASILSQRRRFKNFFRTNPTVDNYVSGLLSILQFYNWRKVHFLNQEENLFTDVSVVLYTSVMNYNITR